MLLFYEIVKLLSRFCPVSVPFLSRFSLLKPFQAAVDDVVMVVLGKWKE